MEKIQLNSPHAEARSPRLIRTSSAAYTALLNYPKAIDFGNRALKGSNDPEIKVAVAQALLPSLATNKEAVRLMTKCSRASGKAKKTAAADPGSCARWATTHCSSACLRNAGAEISQDRLLVQSPDRAAPQSEMTTCSSSMCFDFLNQVESLIESGTSSGNTRGLP
jgi:hypothetical protein